MPVFSVGDLIVLCVVLLILIIFRSLDRNNRSIEKLKRFSDKLSENLAAMVEEKTKQLKEISTALATDLRAGKELLGQVQGMEQGLEGKAQLFETLQSRLNAYDKTLGDLIAASGRVDENLKNVRQEAGFVETVGRRLKESGAQMQRLETEIPALDEKIKAAGKQALKEILARVSAIDEKLLVEGRKKLESAAGEIASSLDARTKGMRTDLEASEKKVKDFAAYMARLEGRLNTAESERVAGLKKTLDSFEAELKGKRAAMAEETGKALEGLMRDAAARIAAQRQEIAEAARRGETLEGEVFTKLREAIEKDEAAMTDSISKLETRYQDYEADIEYRFKKLEETGGDIGKMEKSLRQSIDKSEAGAREAMKELSERLSAEWKAEISAVQAEKLKLSSGMNELAETLAGLKSTAYQNVSEKLQVFEDEFFTDLRARSAAMQEKLQSWQGEVEARNQEAARRHSEDREKLERAFQDDLKSSLERLKKASGDEILRVESRVSGMEASVRDRIAELSVALEAGRKELAETVGAVQADVAARQAAIQKSMGDTEASIMKKIAAAAFDAENAIGNIRDVFTTEKEEILVSTQEARGAVKDDISDLSARISGLRAELERMTGSAVEALNRELEASQVENQKKMREAQSDVEAKVRDLKALISDNREKAEVMQEKMSVKIEESARILTASITEIEKRVKVFSSQTKIFERADTLRATLETGIEDMKKEISKLGSEKAELSELETRLSKTRRMADDISAKLGRFLAEKRRIEEMEGEFKKILALSKDVDVKVESLTSHSDALQEIQAKIRQFEEMGREVENGFDRLEKKQEIITVTSQGVDRNFQRLESLEKLISTAGKESESLILKINSLRADLEAMALSKKDAEAVAEISGRLGGVLADLESRFDKAQNAREWLARTETRFEEIGRQAQEQVRLLESIVKAENKREKGDRGAPPLDKRETVVKLAHQGWSVPEISRVTQLSRGEVELILELAPKV